MLTLKWPNYVQRAPSTETQAILCKQIVNRVKLMFKGKKKRNSKTNQHMSQVRVQSWPCLSPVLCRMKNLCVPMLMSPFLSLRTLKAI